MLDCYHGSLPAGRIPGRATIAGLEVSYLTYIKRRDHAAHR